MAVKTIRAAGQMRGINLSWWSPTLYFKAILHAITWSDQLAQAMESHGYVEDRADQRSSDYINGSRLVNIDNKYYFNTDYHICPTIADSI